jgi:hypothetical protein
MIWTEGTAVQNMTLDLRLQLERGPKGTEFERRDYAIEERHCYRYYQRIPYTRLVGVAQGANSISFAVSHLATMRAAPAFSLLSTAPSFYDAGAGVTGTAALGSTIPSDKSSYVEIGGLAGLSAGRAVIGGSAADFLALDAEL